jgi:hypothetical protein
MDRDAKFREKVEKERRHRSNPKYYWQLRGEVLFSEAFCKISAHGPAVTAYLIVLAKQPFPPNAKRRKQLEKAGLWPPTPTPFSFPVREAPHHGLTEKGLLNGLRRLHAVGLIDLIHHGSARLGDFNVFVVSERWRKFGRDDFERIEWPKSKIISVRDKETGKFVRTRSGKKRPHPPLKGGEYGDYYKHGEICRYQAGHPPSIHGKSCDYRVVVAAKPAALDGLVETDSAATRNFEGHPWGEEEPLVADFGEWSEEFVQ